MTKAFTSLSQGTGVWGVWVSMVITEVFGDVVACQLSHNVGDVTEGAEVLQTLVSTTLWRKTRGTLTTKINIDSLKTQEKLMHSIS